jgi:hypothetical protein
MVRLAARLEQTHTLHFEVNLDSREEHEFYVRAFFVAKPIGVFEKARAYSNVTL